MHPRREHRELVDDRGGRLNEVFRLLRHLWTAPEEPWRGRFFDIPAVGLIKPLTPGGPPLFAGASAPAGLRRAAPYADGFISTPLPPETLTRTRSRLEEIRARFGRTGDFPLYTQALPPTRAGDAVAMMKAYLSAGVDGLILTYPGGVSATGFLEQRDLALAVLEAAQSLKAG